MVSAISTLVLVELAGVVELRLAHLLLAVALRIAADATRLKIRFDWALLPAVAAAAAVAVVLRLASVLLPRALAAVFRPLPFVASLSAE